MLCEELNHDVGQLVETLSSGTSSQATSLPPFRFVFFQKFVYPPAYAQTSSPSGLR